ncbi:hypothetical protein BH10PSE7_BH10PSE7_43070 [soil metagenome]
MDAPADLPSLADIRHEIDAIDDGLLDLVARRLASVEQVRRVKARTGDITQSPIRPAREAFILRRLIKKSEGRVPADLCVRLWRALISAATLQQAPVGIHITAELLGDAGARMLISDHFGPANLTAHYDVATAFSAIAKNPGDIAIVSVTARWPEPFLKKRAGDARVICCLPFLAEAVTPRLLVFGHAPPEPTGNDETLVISKEPAQTKSLWQAEIGDHFVTSLPGFLSGSDPLLAGVSGLIIAGCYPHPLEARR